MKTIRFIISHTLFIHLMPVLGLFALWGNIMTGEKYLLLPMALSFSGAVCGSFIKVLDEIRKGQK